MRDRLGGMRELTQLSRMGRQIVLLNFCIEPMGGGRCTDPNENNLTAQALCLLQICKKDEAIGHYASYPLLDHGGRSVGSSYSTCLLCDAHS